MVEDLTPPANMDLVCLGLFAQGVIKEIHGIEDSGGNLPKKFPALEIALQSLGTLLGIPSTVPARSPFQRSYLGEESLETARVSGSTTLEEAYESIELITQASTPSEDRLTYCQKTLKFFRALSTESVRRLHQSEYSPPRA